jgi:hypothetical protein
LVGGKTSSIAFMLFLPTSIPPSCTKNHMNSPADTPKAHLFGFIFNPCFRVHSRVLFTSSKCES